MSSFGIRLKAARKGANMTQQELAETAKINQSTISLYEKGKKLPNNFDDIIQIAETLQCDIKWLQNEWRAMREYILPKSTQEEDMEILNDLIRDLSIENLLQVRTAVKKFLNSH